MGPFDIDNLKLEQVNKDKKIVRFHPSKAKSVRIIRGERFLKGPIPLKWLTHASMLPGKSLQVGIALWYLKGLKKNSVVKLTNVTLSEFGVKKDAKRRALKSLEEAGLVSIERYTGKNPIVTILNT
jgi:hypothetical protein